MIDGPGRKSCELDRQGTSVGIPLQQFERVLHWFWTEFLFIPQILVKTEEALARALRSVDEASDMVGRIDVPDNLDSAFVQFPV